MRLPEKGDSNTHGARPVYSNDSDILTSRLSTKNSLAVGRSTPFSTMQHPLRVISNPFLAPLQGILAHKKPPHPLGPP